MSEQIDIDEEQLRLALATRPPQTKEEFFLYAKASRFPCESCKGTGKDLSPGVYGHDAPCQRCNGEGKTGMHFGRVAVCPGHSAPLDVFWGLFSQQWKHVFIRANRAGGKTKGISFIEHMMMHHRQFTIAHMGGSEAQANRGRDYFHSEIGVEPWSDAVATREPGQTRVQFHNGAKIEWLPSTEKQASGPHPELSVLDELDEVDYSVRERFVKTPSGPRAMMIEASTWYGQEGTISRVRKENPGLVEKVYCLWESISRCEYSCEAVPLKDGTIGRCPLYEMEEMQADGSLKVVELCGGKLARLSDGHISVPDAVANWQRSNIHSRKVEHLCQEPTIPSSILAYWAYSSQFSPLGNVLPFDPQIRYDQPIHWTLDFNINPMSSFIIQQAPLEYPDEWWIVDEFYIYTVSTEWICQEFINRYGIGGVRLPFEGKATGIIGGLEVYGDWTGHNRTGTSLKSHYSIIQDMLKHTPGFRIMVQSTDVAHPVDRLNLTNQMFFDLKSGSKRRFLKIAPRCVNGIRELGIMPRRAGTFEKDKSDRVQQQLGLSHLGDALECWVWKKFPHGPCPGLMPYPQASGQREVVSMNQFIGGRRTTGASLPWNNQEDQGPWR